MKEWSELEERYQQMMTADPASAQTFRTRMTAKFQANVQVSMDSFLYALLKMHPLWNYQYLSLTSNLDIESVYRNLPIQL